MGALSVEELAKENFLLKAEVQDLTMRLDYEQEFAHEPLTIKGAGIA